jgi:hypothetical protein
MPSTTFNEKDALLFIDDCIDPEEDGIEGIAYLSAAEAASYEETIIEVRAAPPALPMAGQLIACAPSRSIGTMVRTWQ